MRVVDSSPLATLTASWTTARGLRLFTGCVERAQWLDNAAIVATSASESSVEHSRASVTLSQISSREEKSETDEWIEWTQKWHWSLMTHTREICLLPSCLIPFRSWTMDTKIWKNFTK
jgi:hypothetical protein